MNKVKKFESFEELKSNEIKPIKKGASLKKHTDFKKVMEEIRAAKINQDRQRRAKP